MTTLKQEYLSLEDKASQKLQEFQIQQISVCLMTDDELENITDVEELDDYDTPFIYVEEQYNRPIEVKVLGCTCIAGSLNIIGFPTDAYLKEPEVEFYSIYYIHDLRNKIDIVEFIESLIKWK